MCILRQCDVVNASTMFSLFTFLLIHPHNTKTSLRVGYDEFRRSEEGDALSGQETIRNEAEEALEQDRSYMTAVDVSDHV